MENANLSKTTLKWLHETAQWARFIAILGFIFTGFILLMAIFITPVLSYLNEEMTASSGTDLQVSSITLAVTYVILAAIYFFPILYLFRFSNELIIAYKANDEENLNASFRYLKKHFKFIGVILIVILAIYILIFIGAIAAVLIGLA